MTSLQAHASELPQEIGSALSQSGIPESSFSCSVLPAGNGTEGFSLNYRADEPRRPASVMKVVTTAAALDILGPGAKWKTEILSSSVPENGRVGKLYIRGGGAPWIPASDFRDAVRYLLASGLRSISDGVTVDRSVFGERPLDPAAFDGDPARPYNQGHDALGLGLQAVTLTFIPNVSGTEAAVMQDPELSGFSIPRSVRADSSKPCAGTMTSMLKPESDGSSLRFLGDYPASCGRKVWSVVPWPGDQTDRYPEAVFRSVWERSGGTLEGRFTEGSVPEDAVLLYTIESKSLSEIIREINKSSINPMARNLFLSLSEGERTLSGARNRVALWLAERGIGSEGLFIENGSGLSRLSRISARQLSEVLRYEAKSDWAPEFIASLPIAGIDGTMRKRPLEAGSAHVKTGYIRGVWSVAGYVRAESGRWYAVSGIVNEDAAPGSGKKPLDALLKLVAKKG